MLVELKNLDGRRFGYCELSNAAAYGLQSGDKVIFTYLIRGPDLDPASDAPTFIIMQKKFIFGGPIGSPELVLTVKRKDVAIMD